MYGHVCSGGFCLLPSAPETHLKYEYAMLGIGDNFCTFLLTFDSLLDSNDYLEIFLTTFRQKCIGIFIYYTYFHAYSLPSTIFLFSISRINWETRRQTHTYTLTQSNTRSRTLAFNHTHTRTQASIHITIVKTINNVLESVLFYKHSYCFVFVAI